MARSLRSLTKAEREALAREAEAMAGMWLYRGNKASERGEAAKAERHYERAQTWHDRMNKLRQVF